MTYKAIIMDIDGTLVTKDQKIPPETLRILKEVQEEGMQLVLASGRPINGMLHLAKELDMDKHHGICICFNGAKVVDVQTMEEMYNQTMKLDVCKSILHHLKQFESRVLVVKDDYAIVKDVYDCNVTVNGNTINIIQHESHDNNYKLMEVDDMEEFVDYELNKIMVIGEPEYLMEHYQEMYEPFVDICNAMFTAPYYYEFTDKGIDKVHALEESLVKLGIHADKCIAFGDAQNDNSMIQWAKLGIAMGNAHESTKKIANEVTKAVWDEGIAVSLRKHLKRVA